MEADSMLDKNSDERHCKSFSLKLVLYFSTIL